MRERILDDYYNIAHNTIAAMLEQEDYLQEITTIQISTCHRFASICFTNREIRNFCQNEHLLLPNIYVKFEPDYQTRIRISIENIPIELSDREVKKFLSQYTTVAGKTYYPGIRHKNNDWNTSISMREDKRTYSQTFIQIRKIFTNMIRLTTNKQFQHTTYNYKPHTRHSHSPKLWSTNTISTTTKRYSTT